MKSCGIAIIGSDIHPPFVSMEAKLVDSIVRGADSGPYSRVSICVGKPAGQDQGYIYVDGARNAPLLVRKLLYVLKLLIAIMWLRMKGVCVFHFMWAGPPWLMRVIRILVRLLGGVPMATVLNRFIPAAAYKGYGVIVTHSAGTARKFREELGNVAMIVTIPPVVVNSKIMREKESGDHFLYLSAPKSFAQFHSRGIGLIEETFAILAVTRPHVRLRIFGRWPEGDPVMEQQFTTRGLAAVSFVHEFDGDILDEIAASRGVIIPYVGECVGDVPLSALEAAACGRVVVATPGLGLSELLSDYPGYIESSNDTPRAFAEALAQASRLDLALLADKGILYGASENEYAGCYVKLYRGLMKSAD